MTRIFSLMVILTSLAISSQVFGQNSEFRYLPPPNISMRIIPVEKNIQKDQIALEGLLESQVGVPTKLRIFFECSEDLKISPASASVEDLKPGKPSKYLLGVKAGNGKPGLGGTFVRMGVEYLPDYDALIKAMGNEEEYPDKSERQSVINGLREAKKTGTRKIDAMSLTIDKSQIKK
ncbi:MAG: hypothetical protein HQM08_19470 [Candidatus Riflebacteria bacterium]|nr:hypothetical protein [Candidatus Riflebacteria bacterium]